MNWEIVCRPKNCGGARVRDPNKMNLTLGAKILWRIVSRKKHGEGDSSKKISEWYQKKSMDKIDQDRKGTPIWDLCKREKFILQDHLHWIPRSGKHIKFCKDNLGPTSLANFL